MAKSAKSKSRQKDFPTKSSDAPTLSTGKPAPGLLELFTEEIKDIYWAENHLVKSLPKMIKASASKALAAAITEHLEVTKTHVTRLGQVFELLGTKPKAKKCDAMEGLTKEGEGCIEATEDGSIPRNVAIILGSQKVEHYEMAAYRGLSKFATSLGLTEIADLLSQTLQEEIEADEILGALAEEELNPEPSA